MKMYLFLPVLIAVLTLSEQTSIGQEVSNVERELERFPWYESGKLKDLPRLESGRAQTLNRASVPKYVKKVTNNTQTNPVNTAPPNSQPISDSFLQTMVFIALMIGVIVLVVVFLWVFFKTNFHSTNKARKDLAQDAIDLQTRISQLPFKLDEKASHGNFGDLALAAARRKDFAKAIMLLFSHVLLGLDQKGLVQLKKGKTNRQYLLELQEFKNLSQYFEGVMVSFEDSFFGNHAIEERRFAECFDGLEPFQAELETIAQAGVL